MTSTLLFFHLLGMTIILGLFGSLQISRQSEDGKVAPSAAWVVMAVIAAFWPVIVAAFAVLACATYAGYRLERWNSARKPPSPGGPNAPP